MEYVFQNVDKGLSLNKLLSSHDKFEWKFKIGSFYFSMCKDDTYKTIATYHTYFASCLKNITGSRSGVGELAWPSVAVMHIKDDKKFLRPFFV